MLAEVFWHALDPAHAPDRATRVEDQLLAATMRPSARREPADSADVDLVAALLRAARGRAETTGGNRGLRIRRRSAGTIW